MSSSLKKRNEEAFEGLRHGLQPRLYDSLADFVMIITESGYQPSLQLRFSSSLFSSGTGGGLHIGDCSPSPPKARSRWKDKGRPRTRIVARWCT